MFTSSYNDYAKWLSTYKNCVYVDGNLEITNFNPYFDPIKEDDPSGDSYLKEDALIDAKYNFSFLDDIEEITGYLLIHNTRIRNLKLKNLKIIRGKNLIQDKFSVFIGSNVRLERLDFLQLRGSFYNYFTI